MRPLALSVMLAAAVLSGCAPVSRSVAPDGMAARAASDTVSGSAAGCPVPPDVAALRAGMLSAVNARRRAAGLAPLRPSTALERAATIVACDNSRRGRMTHVTQSGADLRGRMRGQGYGFRRASEALAHGYASPTRLESVWAGSSYHYPTLMTPSARDTGIAVVLSPSGSPWWAMISAQPR